MILETDSQVFRSVLHSIKDIKEASDNIILIFLPDSIKSIGSNTSNSVYFSFNIPSSSFENYSLEGDVPDSSGLIRHSINLESFTRIIQNTGVMKMVLKEKDNEFCINFGKKIKYTIQKQIIGRDVLSLQLPECDATTQVNIKTKVLKNILTDIEQYGEHVVMSFTENTMSLSVNKSIKGTVTHILDENDDEINTDSFSIASLEQYSKIFNIKYLLSTIKNGIMDNITLSFTRTGPVYLDYYVDEYSPRLLYVIAARIDDGA